MKYLLICTSLLCYAAAFAQDRAAFVVSFENDEYRLSPSTELALREWLNSVKPRIERIEIHGHSDSLGSRAYNLRLSEKRAKAVEDVLAKQVPEMLINTSGKGESVPVSDQVEKNRRVEVFIHLKKQMVQPRLKEVIVPPNDDSATNIVSVGYNKEMVTEAGLVIRYDQNRVSIKKASTVLSDEDMIESGVYAFDQRRRPLISGGMAIIEFENKMDDTVSISIPARRLDNEMKLYTARFDEYGNVEWVVSNTPLQIDSASGTYNFETVVGTGLCGFNADKRGFWTYVFQVPTDSIKYAYAGSDLFTFSGLYHQEGVIPVFTSDRKRPLRRTVLSMNYYRDGKLEGVTIKRRHLKKKRKGRTINFSPKRRFERKYDLMS